MRTILLFFLSIVCASAQLNISNPFFVGGVLKPAAASSFGPVGIDVAVATNVSSGTSMTIAISSTNPNRLLFVGVGGYDGTRTISSVTHNGGSCTLLYSTNFYDASGNGTAAIYYRIAPDSGTGNIVVTYDDALPALNSVIGVMLTNVNQSTPLGTFASKYNASASPVPGVTNTVTSSANDLVVDYLVAHPHNATFSTSGTSQTELTNTFQSGLGGSRVSYSSAVGSVQMSWIFSGADQAQSHIAVPVKAR